jgi:malonate transporter MadL subunit
MIIKGVALLAACTLAGAYVGDLLGALIGVKANVGGVGVAMLLLIAARAILIRQGALSEPIQGGVAFWSMMYIPIVVAMASQQNVVAAVRGGPMVLLAGCLAVLASFMVVALLGGRVGARPASRS